MTEGLQISLTGVAIVLSLAITNHLLSKILAHFEDIARRLKKLDEPTPLTDNDITTAFIEMKAKEKK